MESHEPDLREEIKDDDEVRRIQDDYRNSSLDPATKKLLDFASKLTLTPKEISRTDVEVLRASGFADEDILDAAQLIGYFNYTNRVMDSLGIEPEPGMRYKAK
ncbi:MAG: peroxidase [Nitrospirae bacterium]|nr:peroxidase [Nitrospirota bacterium]